MKQTIALIDAQQANTAMRKLWETIKPMLMAGNRMRLTLEDETRTLEQNALLWSLLTDLSEQVMWDGTRRLTPEGWKDYLTAHLNGQDLVPNMDGTGFVAIGRGKSTSKMGIKDMIAVIDLGHMFGATKGVVWRQTSIGRHG